MFASASAFETVGTTACDDVTAAVDILIAPA
jgi:hypothetical protein